MEGWRVASKGPGPLPRRRESALAHGGDRGGRGALPLARAAAVSTGLRVLDAGLQDVRADDQVRLRVARARDLVLRVRVRVSRVRVRVEAGARVRARAEGEGEGEG